MVGRNRFMRFGTANYFRLLEQGFALSWYWNSHFAVRKFCAMMNDKRETGKEKDGLLRCQFYSRWSRGVAKSKAMEKKEVGRQIEGDGEERIWARREVSPRSRGEFQTRRGSGIEVTSSIFDHESFRLRWSMKRKTQQ